MAIWTKKSFIGKTLFGKSICFDKVILRDEIIKDKPDQKNFMYIVCTVPMSNEKVCNLTKVASGNGYDETQQMLWVRCNTIDMGVAKLKVITDYVLGKTTLSQHPMVFKSLMDSITAAANIEDRVEIIKSLYADTCANFAKLTIAKSSEEKKPATATTSSEHMLSDNPWYAGDPFYATNNPGSIALGETENDLYYNRKYEVPIMFPERFSPSPDCKGACLERYRNVNKKERFVPTANFDDIFSAGSAKMPLFVEPAPMKKEYLSSTANISVGDAYTLFKPQDHLGKFEYMSLFSVDAHMDRVEKLTDQELYDVFQTGSAKDTIMLVSPKGKKEYLRASDALTLDKAFKLFEPKSPFAVEALSSAPATMDQMYKLFTPRKEVGIEKMSSSIGVASQVRAAKIFLNEIGKPGSGSGLDSKKDLDIFKPGSINREHMTQGKDPRFMPFNALVHYQIGSDAVDIDRVYGTVAQKRDYPKYTDLIKSGQENFGSFGGDQFYDSLTRH
jgi:hypothetical protein